MKRFSMLSFFALLIGGVLMTFLPIFWFPSFYDVRYSGWTMIAGALIIYFLPASIRVPLHSPDASRKNQAVDLLQFLIAIAIMADDLGALGLYTLYQYGIPYSYMLHVIIPLISVILLSIVINSRFDIRLPLSILIAFILVLICGLAWEIFENLCDHFLNTHLTGPDQLTSSNTTALNLIQDLIGSSIGAVIALLSHDLVKRK